MGDYRSIGSEGRLGNFELHGKSNYFGNQGFSGLGEISTSTVAPAAGCPGVQGLATQAINSANSGDFATAKNKASQAMNLAQQRSSQPSYAVVCAPAVSIMANLQGQIVREEAQQVKGAAKEDDTSAGEVLTGIGSILGSVANPLAQVFATHQQTQVQLEQIKQGRVATPLSPGPAGGARFVPGQQTSAAAARSNTTVAIIAIVAGIGLLGVMYIMSKK